MRTIPLHLFGLMLLFLDPEVMSQSSNCDITTNGCSVPGNLPFLYKKTFTPACVKHDVCYDCGEHWRWKRSDCDDRFKQDMYKLCEEKGGGRKRWSMGWVVQMVMNKVKRCKKLGADSYYGAVRVAGGLYWSKVSPEWCKAACTKSLGDPSVPLKI